MRLGSTPSRTLEFDLAHAPFGEIYASSGTLHPAFTGQRQDTVTGLYDFPEREYSIQGRWPSPDPAGLAAVNLTKPQSWNRFSYVRNSPLNLIDPLGMNDCAHTSGDCGTVKLDGTSLDVSGWFGRSLLTFFNASDAFAQCPNNDCTGVRFTSSQNGTGTLERWIPGGQTSWAMYVILADGVTWARVQSGSGQDISGRWEVIGAPDGNFAWDSGGDLGALQYQQYQGTRLVKGLTPTTCGGGGFLFLGLQPKKGSAQGFVGPLLEWDSKSGWSGHGLFELGSHGAGGGAITNPLDGMVFLPAGEGVFYGVPVEGGTLGTTSGAVGGYAEVGHGNVGGGIGGYVNISTVLACGGG